MKKSRYTETQIVKAIKEHEAGKSVQDICRELGVSNVTFYNWKQRYGGMEGEVYRTCNSQIQPDFF